MMATPEETAHTIVSNWLQGRRWWSRGKPDLLMREIAEAITYAERWEAYKCQLRHKAELERLQRIEAAAKAHLADWESGDTFGHESRAALKRALEREL